MYNFEKGQWYEIVTDGGTVWRIKFDRLEDDLIYDQGCFRGTDYWVCDNTVWGELDGIAWGELDDILECREITLDEVVQITGLTKEQLNG